MDDTMHVVEVRESFKDGQRHNTDDIDINRSNFLVDPVEGAFVRKFHTYADVGVVEVCTVE